MPPGERSSTWSGYYGCNAAITDNQAYWGISHEIRAPQAPGVMLDILEHVVLLFTHLIPRACLSLGEGNGNPLQYSCLENPMDGGAW